jgi:hypothetical protein
VLLDYTDSSMSGWGTRCTTSYSSTTLAPADGHRRTIV